MKLCIAEKPSVAREIARVLGANAKRDGYYEGNGYCVTWTFGHFFELEEPGFYNKNWKHWNLGRLPMFPQKYETRIKNDQGIANQFGIIKRLVGRSDEVINCGDAGQEGELIQRWVLKNAEYEKPHKRLWISSLTDEAIRKGFRNLHDSSEFDNLYHAGLIRAIGDWALGLNSTRAYTLKFGRSDQLLSVGRVQTPTLSIIVDRHKEIANFKPEPYWRVVTQYRDVKFNHQKKRFKKKQEAEDVLSAIENQALRISNIEKKTKKIPPPKLFDLTTLQVECNRHFGFSADRTLKIAQQLYEKKLITYPRVDSQYLPEDMIGKIPNILAGISRIEAYAGFTAKISKKPGKSKRYFDDKRITDHHAIVPTDHLSIRVPNDDFKVLDLITRRFLGIFFPDAVEDKTKVTALVADHRFHASGTVLKEAGWKEVYHVKEEKKRKESEQKLPLFEKDESGPHRPGIEQKETQAPKRYTEATLLRSMEACGKMVDDDDLREALKENGIGTPATRAGIIEILLSRKYIRREKKNLVPTELGIYLIDSIHNQTLKSPELTGEWEKKLRKIRTGDFKVGRFYKELQDYVTAIIDEVRNIPLTDVEMSETAEKTNGHGTTDGLAACPKCKNGTVVESAKAFGCNRWRNGCDFTVWKTISKKKISANQAKTLIKKGRTALLKGFTSKQDKKFNAALVLDPEFKVRFEFEQ
ncbi:MAG: DNA topoisomerase III [Proteobacteria bacterium]|nr:DNA topoisomerase III [Pseudomonadota bacterium]